MGGIHHVTAISGPAARNLDFYARVLGLRLVKRTVNFDDPTTHHLYYGDARGRPGTILTFFPWEHAATGRAGVGLAQQTLLRVPQSSMPFWTRRLIEHGVRHDAPELRFGDAVLPLLDPDGTALLLAGVPEADEPEELWCGDGIPAEHAIRGLHGVTLMLDQAARTAAVLTDVFGFVETDRSGNLIRFRAPGSAAGAVVDIRQAGDFLKGRLGQGIVHHVAFRAADDAEQASMARKVVEDHRLTPTEQKDRVYFRSIYFREPGGVLFEIATDQPGFAIDEPQDALGRTLKLPPWLEPRRADLEAQLPRL